MTTLPLIVQRLHENWKRLQDQWQATTPLWQDAVQQRFDSECWQAYEHTLPPLFREIENLNNTIVKANMDMG